jgi:hypothetical protein
MATTTNGHQNSKHGKSSFVIFTLKLVREPEAKYAASGTFYTKTRGLLPTGKDKQSGDWLPGKFFDLDAFSKGGDESLPTALAGMNKGDWATFKGHLVYEEYTKQDNTTGSSDKIIVQSIDPYTNGHDDGESDEAIEIDA